MLNVVIGFVGISRVNLPLFLCLRRTTIVFLLVGEAVVLHKFASRTATYVFACTEVGCSHADTLCCNGFVAMALLYCSVCVGTIALGTIVAGWHSLAEGSASDERWVSYGFVLANNLATAGYLLKVHVFTFLCASLA